MLIDIGILPTTSNSYVYGCATRDNHYVLSDTETTLNEITENFVTMKFLKVRNKDKTVRKIHSDPWVNVMEINLLNFSRYDH